MTATTHAQAALDLPWDDGNRCGYCRAGVDHTHAQHVGAALAAHDTEADYEGGGLYGWQCHTDGCDASGHGLRSLDDARDQADAHMRDAAPLFFDLTPAARLLLADAIADGGTITAAGLDPDTLAGLVAAGLITDHGTAVVITDAGRTTYNADTWAGRDDDPNDPDWD